MKFGPLPVAEALGAILAHSVGLPTGRLRKGVQLEHVHLKALAEAGYDHIVVAQLEAVDLHENEAARALALALADGAPGLAVGEAFTGRVNLTADGPGVVLLDAEAIHAANLIDPAITIATVVPFHQTHSGGMVATVKIIPYGAGKAAVAKACTVAKGAIRLSSPVFRTASLVVSEIPGGAGRKGVDAIENRLERLGLSLSEVLTCAHSEKDLAEALAAARGEVILVLTGSATSDSADTAPAALRLAGGRLERFGMPVDPGNLLFLGALNGAPVIGLPGSARSPVLHGADWVLSRVVCGIEVSSDDIARMGVGGLLKEIPTRPQPRRGRRAS